MGKQLSKLPRGRQMVDSVLLAVMPRYLRPTRDPTAGLRLRGHCAIVVAWRAMEAGVTDRLLSLEDMVGIVEEWGNKGARQ